MYAESTGNVAGFLKDVLHFRIPPYFIMHAVTMNAVLCLATEKQPRKRIVPQLLYFFFTIMFR